MFLYEDYGSVSHKDLVEKYEHVHLYTIQEVGIKNYHNSRTQHNLYHKLLYDFKKNMEYDWVAFFDVDEFLVFDKGYDLETLCDEFKDYAGVWLAWKMYNACGHIKRPKGKVIDSYPYAFDEKSWMCLDSTNGNQFIWNKKSIVNLHKAQTWYNIHEIKGGCDVEFSQNIFKAKVFKKAWINHYFTKSWEDYCERMQSRGNMRNDLRTFDQFFLQNPELMYKKKELIEKERKNHLSGNMYISRDMHIISVGNIDLWFEVQENHKRKYS